MKKECRVCEHIASWPLLMQKGGGLLDGAGNALFDFLLFAAYQSTRSGRLCE